MDGIVDGVGGTVSLDAHVNGNPVPGNGGSGGPSVGHTWLIIVVALLILWLLGGVVFRGIRVG